MKSWMMAAVLAAFFVSGWAQEAKEESKEQELSEVEVLKLENSALEIEKSMEYGARLEVQMQLLRTSLEQVKAELALKQQDFGKVMETVCKARELNPEEWKFDRKTGKLKEASK